MKNSSVQNTNEKSQPPLLTGECFCGDIKYAINGPELISNKLARWCEENQVDLAFIQPGKPTQNAFVERFNRTFRNEVLNAHLFDSLAQVQEMAWWWMIEYNEERPHDSTGRVPPTEYRKKLEREMSTLELSH